MTPSSKRARNTKNRCMSEKKNIFFGARVVSSFRKDETTRAPKKMFFFSLMHLFFVFLALLLDGVIAPLIL